MKNSTLKKLTIILLILMISLISFLGIYVQKLNRMKNILPDYKIGMDFDEIHVVRLGISQASELKYYDAEGKEVSAPTEETEDAESITSKEVKTNPEEVLTEENFKKVKEIMIKRLKDVGVSEYYFRQDENGYISVEFPESDSVDNYITLLTESGTFQISDAETEEILMDEKMISNAFATTYTDEENKITAYLIINFDKEGKEKLKEVSETYIQTTDEEGNETTKEVTIKLNGSTIRTTYFGQTLSNGQIQLSLGEATSDREQLIEYYRDAAIIATVLNDGSLPIVYEQEYDSVHSSVLRQEVIQVLSIAIAVILVIAVAYLIIRFNNGLFMGIAWLGFISAFLLVLRLTNSIISYNSIIAIIFTCIFEFIFVHAILNNKDNKEFNEIAKSFSIIGIPICIVAIIFTFASLVPVSSFGIALFWGSALMIAYNIVITKNLYDAK